MHLGKLKWRSRRSILELDLYFDAFIKRSGLENLSIEELHIYAKLLELEDGYLLLLFQGKETMASLVEQKLVDKIRIRI